MSFKFSRQHICRACVLLGLIALAIEPAQGIVRRIRPVPGQPGMVNLPYMTGDNQGNQWMVYQPGMLQMQGNFPVYSQAAQLMVNGNQPSVPTNTARLDDKTGELLLENMQAGSFVVTRRILFNTDESYVRCIDIIKNTQAQEQQLNLQITSNVNFGVQSSTMVSDPKKKDQNLAWVAQVNGPGRAAVDVYAGRGSKVVPTLNCPQGNNFVQANLTMPVPANKEIAVVHFHCVALSQDAGVQWVNGMKEDALLADVPKDVRKLIVNFRVRQSLLGDLEVLRGDVMDVVELRSGDKFNGNLAETSYKLDTFYGMVELPVNEVVSIINAGQYRPRQLVVTQDGQIFGGHLQKPTIDLELSSGQKTQIPLSQISRVGYRRRASETEEGADQTLQPPYVIMGGGDRVAVAMPGAPIPVMTRYGQLMLSPDVISSIVFASEESGVHTIYLNDGSHFSGLVTLPDFEMTLTTGGKQQSVKFPVGSLNRLVLKYHSDDKEDGAQSLQIKKDDLLVGVLQGQLKLDTSFDTITVSAPEIKAMMHPKENSPDVSITTWDGAIFSGQLQDQDLLCHLSSGLDVRVPVALVDSYTNTKSQAPTMMVDRIKTIVADLNADDWKQRDAAEKQLVAIGPGVAETLKAMRDKQTPEAQQRIDSVLKQLAKTGPAKAPGVAPTPAIPPD